MFSSNLQEESNSADSYSRIYTAIGATGENRKFLSEKLSTFLHFLETMVLEETLHYGNVMHDITNVLTAIININSKIANLEIRCSEDLKDVVERFRVVERVSSEQFQAMKTVDEYTNKLIEAESKKNIAKLQPRYEEIESKLLANISNIRFARKVSLENAKIKTLELIEVQKKYNAFKLKRQIQAWSNFAKSMKSEYDKLSLLFEQLAHTAASLRD